jgi:hypothetical protein
MGAGPSRFGPKFASGIQYGNQWYPYLRRVQQIRG